MEHNWKSINSALAGAVGVGARASWLLSRARKPG